MDKNPSKTSLGEVFSMASLIDVIIKKENGVYELSIFNAILARMSVFQKSAILARAKKEHVKTILKLVVDEGKEEFIFNMLENLAEDLLKQYGEEPSSFLKLVNKLVMPDVNLDDIATKIKLQNQNCRLGEILLMFSEDVIAGIAFGAIHPELVKKMWKNDFEQLSSLSIEEMEGIVISEFEEYVRENRPSFY